MYGVDLQETTNKQESNTANALNELNRRHTDHHMQIVAERIGLLHEDISELKDSMKESMSTLTAAVHKLVQVETRQEAIGAAYTQVRAQLEKEVEKREGLEQRVDSLEKDQPMTKQVVQWCMYAVGAIVLAAATFVGKAVGFM